ncbi:VOC family protein [Microbacterium oxydans]|jgi:PhnB protein|uniref:VOC family protein n=1 Tax=Microbacterium TaxID=33882 RepID=UPI0006293C8D|nr:MULTISPECIES: VOC family protein [Microbacterium]KAB1892541.1 VOC family protein [Microbacterium oxydans]KKX98087.1 glyoxalase/bleomycin resistance protein/dioxygenase [Microbacterium sp. Ag1]NYF30326.1 PhnB protein [Microbacterium sp. JAI119]RBO70510.1 VOC family protein [Microbacterium sp. H6]GED36899.1 VOC family protein [Microbacterium oxydans]
MTITTTTHLNFRGTARQALDFYQSVFGGEVTAATYGQFGMPEGVPGFDKIVFGQLDGVVRLMAYDIPGEDDSNPAATAGSTHRENGATLTDRTFFQSLRADSLDELQRYWNGLVEGATVIESLAASAWSAGFGMLTDRFGVTWVLDVAA